MALRVVGKNLDIGEALRARVAARLTEAGARLCDGRLSGHVTFEKEGHGFRAFAALHVANSATLQAEAFGSDAYAVGDTISERLEKRLARFMRRLKTRGGDRHGHGPATPFEAQSYVIAPPDEDHGDDPATSEFEPVIVAEPPSAMKRLSVAEAVVELDLTGARVLLFQHAGHGRVNIVYRRSDGHVGWVDPPVVTAKALA